MKPRERLEVRRLRAEEGLSMKAIAREVGVSVSSVSLWTRDIELTPEQLASLAERDPRSPNRIRGTTERAARARADRLAAQQHGRELARQLDALHLSGCMLFWAEGSRNRNCVKFTNSDVLMHRCFVRFLRLCYDVQPEHIALTVNCYLNNGLTLGEIETWWLDQLELPASCIRKASVNRPSSASRFRRNTLLHGTARISVHSTFVVQSIYGAIQEYVGEDRPEWLDCAPRVLN